MKQFEITTNMKVFLTTDDIDDIMVSALEGGINYWVKDVRFVETEKVSSFGYEQIARGGSLMVRPIEPLDDADTEVYKLTREKFLHGFQLWLENSGLECGAIKNHRIAFGQMDGNRADSIIQYALFGEIVFA